MKTNNQNGMVLALTLFVLIFLIGFGTIFILRTVHESNLVERELNNEKSFYLTEAGAHAGIFQINSLINNFLRNEINNTNPSTVISNATSYVSSGDGLALLMDYVVFEDNPLLALNGDGTQAEYNTVSPVPYGDGTYDFDIIITEKSDPVTVTSDSWDFNYNFRIEGDGSANGLLKEVKYNGDFTIQVQRDNFAKYALFTNEQRTPSGANVWFTERTNFAGPIHTNDKYNIYGNPSGTFQGLVEQVDNRARYYNEGSTVLLDDDHNGSRDVPNFLSGFNRDVSPISLSSTSDEQDIIDQATGGATYGTDGIYVPHSGSSLTGGIYVRGSGTLTLGDDGSDNATYTITQGGTTKIITVNQSLGQTTVEDVGEGTLDTYSGLPNGQDGVGTIVYFSHRINGIQGTVHGGTGITVSSNDDIIITNNLQYANYSAGSGTPGEDGYVPPSADGYDNMLGLVTWDGDIRIGNSAPDNVNVHATLLAQNGIFTVDDYGDYGPGPRGIATLLGGVISDSYGAFGLFNGNTGQQLTGYGRNFVYDERMQSGGAPPYFPSLNTFIAFTNDIADKLVWQEGS